jgi:hypothetical protein
MKDELADQSAGLDTDAHPLPWNQFAGTIIHDANGKTVLCAAEESELRGGSFDGIRAAVRRSVEAVNTLDAVRAHYNALKASHDRLLEACRLATSDDFDCNDEFATYRTHGIRKTIQTAIAQAEAFDAAHTASIP